jgi:hypothetical protein
MVAFKNPMLKEIFTRMALKIMYLPFMTLFSNLPGS